MSSPRISRRALASTFLAGAAGTWACSPAEDQARGGHCFSGAEANARLDGLRVFQQAPPPVRNGMGDAYPYWPCTDAVTAHDLDRSTWTGGNTWAFVWANRCNSELAWNRKPNPLPPPVVRLGGLECRAVFSTHARANAATRCRVRHLCGADPDEVREPWLSLPGTSDADFVTDTDYRARPDAHCRTTIRWRDRGYRVMVDKVVLPASRITDGPNRDDRAGVVLDYEVQDSRRPEVTEGFVTSLAHDVTAAGKQLTFLTNPFDAPTQRYTGCTAENLPRLLAAVDHLAVFLWSGNGQGRLQRSYAAQLDMLGTLTADDHAKLVLNFELGTPGTTLDDAHWLHDELHGSGTHPDKVMFWRNHAEQGGGCDSLVNRKIAAVCFGD